MNNTDELEQKILRTAKEKLGTENAEQIHDKFHVMYQEKHNNHKTHINTRTETYKRYMTINYQINPEKEM
jgi:nitrous oxide reductase